MAWQRFNRTSNVFEVSDDNGASWQTLQIAQAGLGLGPNIAYRNINNYFVAQTFATASWIIGPNCQLFFNDTSGPVDGRTWRLLSYSNAFFYLELMTEGGGGVLKQWAFGNDGSLHTGSLNVFTGNLSLAGATWTQGARITFATIASIRAEEAGIGGIPGIGIVSANNAAWASLTAANIYTQTSYNSLGDLTCRGATNFQGGINVTAGDVHADNGHAFFGGLVHTQGNAGLPGGVYFPRTTGGMDHGFVLDAYQEGTWAPQVQAQSGGILGSNVTGAFFMKIGRMVWVSAYIYITSGGGAPNAGIVFINGLPYPCQHDTAVNFIWNNIINIGGVTIPWAYIPATASTIYLYSFQSNAIAEAMSKVQNGTDFRLNVVYMTNS